MKRRLTDRTSVWGLTLVIVAVTWSGYIHGQTPDERVQPVEETNEIPVLLVEDIDLLTRLKWTLQVLLVPRSIDHVNPLYAYEPESVEGQEIHLERVGPVAMVGECSVSRSRAARPGVAETWCAQYFRDVTTAYHAAYAAANAAPGDYYFATTYPLAKVRPARRFVSQELP